MTTLYSGDAWDAFATHDPAQAESFGSSVLAPHRLRAGGHFSFDARFRATVLGSTTLGFIEFSDEVRVESSAKVGAYFLLLPLRGRMRAAVDGADADLPAGSGFVVGPKDKLHKRFSAGTTELVLKIPPETLRRQLGLMGGRSVSEDVRFRPSVTDDPHWIQAANFMAASVERCGGACLPQVGHQLEAALIAALLMTQPHQYSGDLLTSTPDRQREAIQRVARRLSRTLEYRLNVPRLAQEEGLTTRELQDGFRRTIGVAPTVYLRQLRLDEVHRRLQHAQHSVEIPTVADIAFSVGFTHLGRFGAAYRDRFGVAPSTTLLVARRARIPDRPVKA